MKVKLDEHQLKAVEHFEGPALVVAGPGSGKTTVIIERIRHLIRKHNVNPERIIAIAFTNAAVDEMKKRLADESNLPEICTLHVFGKEIVTNNFEQANFFQRPDNIWDEKDIKQIIETEKEEFEKRMRNAHVAIYKIVDMTTGRCYIGQTTKPTRRKREHFTHSSNRELRHALQQDIENFKFEIIEYVKGRNAYPREKYWIEYYRNRSINYLQPEAKLDVNENQHDPVVVYKIKSLLEAKCWIGMSHDLQQSIEFHLTYSQDEELLNDIVEGNLEIISDKLPKNEAALLIANEMRKHIDFAVFNRSDPVKTRYSNQLRIEMFCQHFNVSYEDVIKQPEKFHNLMETFDMMQERIMEVKGKVSTGLFKPEKIRDPILRAFAIKYEDIKKQADAIDFFDMLIISAHILENDSELLHSYQEKYRHVLVDEFQDISQVDFRLIKLFPENLFAVGDDDQAIYGFRGGDSEIMPNFASMDEVREYKVTRNYRSTSTVVRHTQTLIEHNSPRINKNLHAENPARSRVEVIQTSPNDITAILLNELLPIVTDCETRFKENLPYLDKYLLQELTAPQQIGILARNWYEVNPIQVFLKSALVKKGFQILWPDSDDSEKRKLIMRRGKKEIKVSTIHSAKGQEWHKVILLVNTVSYSKKPSIPDQRNDLTDERKVFYVAVTRAKHELIIFDGGNCPFIPEFQKMPRFELIQQLQKALISVFRKRLSCAREQLKEVSQVLPTALISQRSKLIDAAIQAARKQHEPELRCLRTDITEAENARKAIELALPQKLKTEEEFFLEKLIPVLDHFDSIAKNTVERVVTNNVHPEMARFIENFHSIHEQLLGLLKNHGLKPIETLGRLLNLDQHEEVQSRIYSDEVPKGNVVKEIQQGYILNDQVIRKAQVVVSKGERQSEWFINLGSAQPMCFVANHRIYTLQNIRILDEIISGVDSQGLVVRIQKPDMLFAFPKRNWDAVKPQPQIAEPTLQRNPISDEFLRSILVKKEALGVNKQRSVLRLVTKAGYVLKGYLQSFDKDVLYMSINKKVVVVFRHGLLEIFHDSDIEGAMNVTLSEVEKSDIECTPKAKPLMVTKSEHSVDKSSSGSQSQVWDKIAKAYANGTPINGYVIQRVKGGVRVRIEMLHGFLPGSQVELRSTPNLDLYVGKTFEMKITEFNKQQDNLVLSRRAWLEEKRSEFLETLEIGQQVTGIVKNITTFGAFVDLGGIDGLIHKTELGWKPIDHPSEVISVGDEVEVKVIEFNREDKKISLSLKQMTSNTWEDVEDKYPIGSTVQGTVVNIVHYGAFLQLEEGVVGLLHVSEMSHTDDSIATTNFLNEGDEVKVVVLEVSKNTKRISLSMKQTQENRLQLLLQKYPDKPK